MQVGGTELNALRTAERLDRRRFSISVVCIRDNGPLMARYKDAGITVHSFPMTSLMGPGALQQAVRLVRLFQSERTDIVHSHDAYTSVFATLCARVAGVRSEERRVGKECRSGWATYDEKKREWYELATRR